MCVCVCVCLYVCMCVCMCVHALCPCFFVPFILKSFSTSHAEEGLVVIGSDIVATGKAACSQLRGRVQASHQRYVKSAGGCAWLVSGLAFSVCIVLFFCIAGITARRVWYAASFSLLLFLSVYFLCTVFNLHTCWV